MYSGDNTNYPATSECGTENFTVVGDPTVSTVMRTGNTVIEHQGELRFLPASVTDTLEIFGTVPGATGTVTFQLYRGADCSGEPVFVSEKTAEITSTNLVVTSDAYAIPATGWGTYNWVVTFVGDANDDGIEDTLVSGCGEETFTGVTENRRTVRIDCSYNIGTNTSSFRVVIAKANTAEPDEDQELIVVATPYDNSLSALAPIDYHAYDSNNATTPPVDFSDQPWRQLSVAITWPDGQTGSAIANCNTNKLQGELTTNMFLGDETPINNGAVVPLGTSVYDTATLTGGTVTWSGTLTYTLYLSTDCDPATQVGSPQVMTLEAGSSSMPPSNTVTVSEPGIYNWVVTYSGDSNNEPATSGCGEEFFGVPMLVVDVLTQVYTAGDAVVPDDGSVPFGTTVYDTTTFTGALPTVSGQVTYTLYATDDCSDDPVFQETVTIANGFVPTSSQQTLTQAGTWNWVVSYSGDSYHDPAVSACGEETVIVEKTSPTITTVLSTEEGSAGDSVYDTSVLAGASDDAGGTVMYYVYANDDCSGDPLYTLGPVDVVDGVVANSPAQIFPDAGHYEWQAVYSGDANNDPATGECGTEPLDIYAPDLAVEKSAADDIISAGDSISFTLTVTNIGEGNAYDVVLTDTLPTGIDWAVNPAVDGCAIADGVLSCDVGTLDSGASFDVTVTGTTDAADCGVVSNSASGEASNEADDVLENNDATAEVEILCPDIEVTKTAGAASVSAGDPISFSMTVTNTGEGRADNVTLSDTLPTGIDWIIAPAVEGCAIADGVLSCDFGTLESGDSDSVTVTGVTDATDCGVVNNSASGAASNESDDDLENNDASAEVEVLCPDLEVQKTAAETSVSASDDVSFTMTVTNIGEGRADGVVLSDTLPTGIDWSVNPAVDGCDITDGVLTCAVGTLASGASFDVTVTGTTDAADCGVISNTASGEASNEADDTLENNEATAEITILCPDLAITKVPGAESISAGDDASFTITVTNLGEGNAYNVIVTDELPAGVEWSVNPAVDGCDITDGLLSCALGTLAPNAEVAITLTGTTDAADCGTLTNLAQGEASNEADDTLENNEDSAEIMVLCPDPGIEKTAVDSDLMAGDQIAYTITVTNHGEGNAYDVAVMDELPSGFNWVVGGEYADSCSASGGALECVIDVLEPGATAEILVTAPTTTSNCGTVTNHASVSASNEPDGTTSPKEASAEVSITCPPPATATPGPITTLPVTGSGSDTGGSSVISMWAQVMAATMLLAGAAVLGGSRIRERGNR